jgi:anti-sigma factor RsiW
MDGQDVERLVELSIDGELAPAEEADLEAQINGSPQTREEAQRVKTFHVGLRRKLRAASQDTLTPPNLKSRVVYRLRCPDEGTGLSRPWGRAVAATLVIAAVAVASWSSGQETVDVEEVVARHSSNLPPEVRARGSHERVRDFLDRNLGYPVQVPRIEERHTRLLGARLTSLGRSDAAQVMLDHRGDRISLFPLPRPSRFRPPPGFEPRVVHGRDVVVGQHRGYQLVLFADGEVVYTLVGTVEPNQLEALVGGFRPSN